MKKNTAAQQTQLPTAKILLGDCRETLGQIPDGSVHCCVTSPPYWGLRSYLPTGHEDKRFEIGSEPTPEAFVGTMVEVFREVRRCLHPSGTLWLNLGDSYAGYHGNSKRPDNEAPSNKPGYIENMRASTVGIAGLKPKDLCMIPWRVALALQADGWWLRSVICWHKKSCMPESVTDRPTNSWEPIFLLAKSAKYFYDAESVKEPATYPNGMNGNSPVKSPHGQGFAAGRSDGATDGTRNQRNVWALSPEPYAEAHFAVFPTEIPRRAILAGTSAKGCCPECRAPWVRVVEKEGGTWGQRKAAGAPMRDGLESCKGTPMNRKGETETRTLGWEEGCDHWLEPEPCTVLDPFAGSGTSGLVALQLGREFIGCELNQEYIELAGRRMFPASAPLFDDMPQMEIFTP